MSKLCFLLFLLASSYGNAEQLELRHRWDVALTGMATELNQDGYSEWQDLEEGLLIVGLNQSAKLGHFLVEARPELRYFASQAANSSLSDIAHPVLKFNDRKIQLGESFAPGPNQTGYFDFEMLSLKFQSENFELLAGRQFLNIGIMKNFPIWNKFASFNLFNTRVPLQTGVDELNARAQGSFWWVQTIAVFGRTSDTDAYLAILGFPLPWVEFQLLASNWWKEKTLGFNISKDLGGVLLKTEWLFVGVDRNDSESNSQGSFGIEYTFNDKISSTFESIYFSGGSSTKGDLSLQPPSEFFPLRSSAYLLLQTDWQITPYWQLLFTPVLNLIDESIFAVLSIKKNLSDNIDLTLQLKAPLGPEQTEFSSRTFESANSTYVGASDSASLQLKMFF